MYRICKQFSCDSAHYIEGLPPDHKCSDHGTGEPHGHTYRIELYLESDKLDKNGLVVDFGELKEFKRRWIDYHTDPEQSGIDHRCINRLPWCTFSPTAENLALFFYTEAKKLYPQVVKVRVYETPTAWAEFENGNSWKI